jgi:hypothetical protein
MATNTHETIELLDVSFYMWSEAYQKKVDDYVFLECFYFTKQRVSLVRQEWEGVHTLYMQIILPLRSWDM